MTFSISISEIIDMIFMSFIVGYIFSDLFRHPKTVEDYMRRKKTWFDWKSIKFAILLTAPAIILHELGHKFVALGFGLNAQFHAAYFWLFLGLIMKMTGFIFLIPAYVSITGTASNIAYSMTALAGPAVNFLLWLICRIALKKNLVKKKYIPLVFMTKRINGFLAVFNMIPIPGFDGYGFLSGLFGF